MKNILLIAGLSEAYYYDAFLKACDGRDIKIYLFDPLSFPKEATISVGMDARGKITGHIDVQEYKSGDFKKYRLCLSDVYAAWYIREGFKNNPAPEELPLESRFSENESRISLRTLFSILDCKWVNKKEIIDSLSSNKLYQQLVASRCGLLVPPTLISNNSKDVGAFSSQNEGLLLKSLGFIKLDEEGKYFLYSNRFSHAELVRYPDAIKNCPIFSQKYIEKLYEHRVMVIGNRVLSCRIDSQASDITRVDWRHYDFKNVEHKQVEIPLDIQKKLLFFMKEVKLQYGAIDLIETPEGDFIFLEVNLSGQWGWIADLARLAIPEVVADMLESL